MKTTTDLLVVRSDVYRITEDYRVVPVEDSPAGAPIVDLDERYYRLIDAFEARFPGGAPSLCACEALTVRGDVKFGPGVSIRGRVVLDNRGTGQVLIDPDTVINADETWG